MPVEARILEDRPVALPWCPLCRVSPLRPFVRGQVQRTWWDAPVEALTAWWTGGPWRYCAVICSSCKSVVDWEAP
jgi:hypothetical protein